MSKTDICTKCGREGHTASSCKRVQCVSCAGFRMALRKVLCTCERVKRTGWSPSPTFWRECGRFIHAEPEAEKKRREALRSMGSIAA